MTRTIRALLLAAAALPLAASIALAGPKDPVVVGGSATVSNPNSTTTVIQQNTDKAIINWRLFDIGVNERATFVQPNASSIALNRVTGGLGPSQILGRLDANGRVFLINRDGILFGPNSVINTAGFLASTHDIKNEDFMAGRFKFDTPGRPDASIVNMGTITAANSGFAALVAPGVRNTGTITANLGNVALAAGNGFTLDFYGDRLVTLAVGDQIANSVRDVATGLPLKALVSNEGKLKANGGRVELTAAAARTVVDSVINTSGVIEANTVGTRGGTIVLSAATADRKPAGAPTQHVKVSGTLKATGNKKDTKGGTVIVTGESIQVAGATIDVSGRVGGGKVLIGGDWGGGNPNKSLINNPSAVLEGFVLPNATTVSVDGATSINASARERGDGGKVVLWANDKMTFAGTILALGGTQFGNGGFIETSGKTVEVSGLITAGKGGAWLLDPANIPVNTALAATIQTALNAGTNFTLETTTSGPGDGDIIFASGVQINWNTSATLSLIAFRHIQFNDGVGGPTPGNIVNTGAGHLVMRADSTGFGIGTILIPGFTFPTRVNWTNSTGTVSIYYNPNGFGTQDDFSSASRMIFAAPGQLTQFMLVNTPSNLQQIGASISTLGQFYALGRDINMNGFPFVPIGAPGSPFTGKLEGLGHTIDNLSINVVNPSINSLGLFGIIGANGIAMNFNVHNAVINANPNVSGPSQFMGIVAGQNFGQIINVDVSGTVNGGTMTGVIAGGAVGQNQFSGFVADVIAAVNVTVGDGSILSGFNSAAGHTAFNHGMIQDSHSSGTVNVGTNSDGAGFVATNSGTVQRSHTTTAVTGTSGPIFSTFLAGFAARNTSSGHIFLSSSSGPVTGSGTTNIFASTQVAGFVVQNAGTIDLAVTTSNVTGDALSTVAGFANTNDPGATIAHSAAFGNVFGSLNSTAGFVNFNAGNIHESVAAGLVVGGRAAGFVNENMGTIFHSRAFGNVNGVVEAAGFVLDNFGFVHDSSAHGDVRVGPFGLAGGFFTLNAGTIDGAHSTGHVHGGDGSILGGFGALNLFGLVREAISTSAVTAGNDSVAAGFVAVNLGEIFRAISLGPVVAGDRSIAAGFTAINAGITGFDFGNISRAYSLSPVTVGDNGFAASFVTLNAGEMHETYSAGLVSGGTNAKLAGHILENSLALPAGFNPPPGFPGTTASTGTATASYWDTQTTGQDTSAGGTPQTTAQLTSGMPAGFNPQFWTAGSPGESYPYLTGQPNPPPQPGQPAPKKPVLASIVPSTFANFHDIQRVVEQPVETTTVLAALTTGPAPSRPGTQQPQTPRGTNVPDRLPSGMPPLNETRFINNEVVLQLSGRATPEEVAAVARRLGLTVIASESIGLLGRTIYRFNTGKLSVREAIRLLEANRIARITASAQPSYVFTLAQAAETPPAETQQGDSAQYIISKLRLPEVHRLSTGKDVTVAVIDSEIDILHPDLAGRIAGRFDAVGADEKPHAHGTGMAGAIISHGKLVGVAPGARVLAVRAFGTSAKSAQGTSLQIVKGMDWAISQGAKVINMSFAGPRDPMLAQAIKAAREKGIILIAAAGNAGPKSPPLYPGADPNVIAVSATDLDDNTYANANRGKHIAVAAPGVDILVPAPDGSYQLTTGTSVATAHVSGVAALLLERNPKLTPDALRAILTTTAKNIPSKAKNNEVGSGLVDPLEALQAPEPKPAAERR